MRWTPPTALLALTFSILHTAIADPLLIPFQDCFDEPESIGQKFAVDSVYAQVLHNDEWGRYLNLTVLGNSPQPIVGLPNGSTSLSTLFTASSVLTLSAWSNSSYLCQTMRPPSPLPPIVSADGTYCPIPAGPFAFSATIPWGRNRELTTLLTRLRAVDPYGKSLVCLDVLTTPLEPLPHSPYGRANIIFWATVALAGAYWLVGSAARVASAWNRGTTRSGGGGWTRARSAGYVLASAISGERLATAPALMRFCTPAVHDVIFHTQWCAVLAMVAVEWPQFVYPLLTQTAWATLSYNISLIPSSHDHHVSPLLTAPFAPSSNFSDQLTDPTSPLFIDLSVPNSLFTLPPSTAASQSISPGLQSFAYTLGIRPQDLFPTCVILFLGIVSATIVLSFLVWFIDYAMNLLSEAARGNKHMHGGMARLGGGVGTRTPPLGYGSTGSMKELASNTAESPRLSPPLGSMFGAGEESKALTGPTSPHARFSMPSSDRERGISSHRTWWTRLRTSAGASTGAFHGSVLHGNLVRLLVLFHLPLTVFSCYHLTLGAGTTGTVLAALSLVIFSVLLPAHLVLRVAFTSTSKLYSETRTLLSLGPLYAHYRAGSQLFVVLFFVGNLAFGIVVGAGQKSGTAQAIVILVVEVALALVTSLWLPWGSGASMGLISFLFCVARIVVAVLLVILTQAISIGPGPGGWVSYGILVILALVYLALFLMLVSKLIEGILRLVFGISFDRSKHTSDTGLLGVLGLLGCACCGGGRRRRGGSRRKRYSRPPREGGRRASSAALGGASQMDRESDMSSYMPPAGGVAPHADDISVTSPPFLRTESRKGSTYSQPPSVLKPEHANRPYRESGPVGEEGEGYIMGAWQPFPRAGGPYSPLSPADVPAQSHTHAGGAGVGLGLGIAAAGYRQESTVPTQKASVGSTQATPSPSGFTRVGGGRAHYETPYAIATGSTQTFPSLGQQSVHSQSQTQGQHQYATPSTSAVTLTGASPTRAVAAAPDDPEPAVSFTSVGSNGLPPGAMLPAHIRTKSQTAIVEDYHPLPASTSAAASGSAPGSRTGTVSASGSRLSVPQYSQQLQQQQQQQQQQRQPSAWDLQTRPPGTRTTHVSEDTYLRPPARFTLGGAEDGEDEDESGDEAGAQRKKKARPWYHLGRGRAHSSEGRTSASASVAAAIGASAAGGGSGAVDAEMGGLGAAPQPQRSFVVIRKPPGSMGRLNQAAGPSGADTAYPKAASRPPTR